MAKITQLITAPYYMGDVEKNKNSVMGLDSLGNLYVLSGSDKWEFITDSPKGETK